jgi:hypothetical protein
VVEGAIPEDPVVPAARLFLSAIHDRGGRSAEAKLRLREVIDRGGDLVVARWARWRWAELHPGEPLAPPVHWKISRRSRRNRRVPSDLVALAACAALVAVSAALASHHAGPAKPAVPDDLDEPAEPRPPLADHRRANALAVAQAERLRAATDALRPGRRGVVDLYFVGAAAWADQDVFLRETRSGRAIVEERFDAVGRSLLLANDPTSRDDLPLVANVTLRGALRAVGERMDRDEDVLFLFVTSHGSRDGLAIGFGRDAPLGGETLTPADVREMLDEAGIRWRVLVLSGCESGVFVDPLRGDRSWRAPRPTTATRTAARPATRTPTSVARCSVSSGGRARSRPPSPPPPTRSPGPRLETAAAHRCRASPRAPRSARSSRSWRRDWSAGTGAHAAIPTDAARVDLDASLGSRYAARMIAPPGSGVGVLAVGPMSVAP